jgi:glycosyltransferase involved in cell wall biosynthesis
MESEYNTVIHDFRPLFDALVFRSLQANSGAPVARNTGIQMASCEWIALVDDDDEWFPQKLEKQWSLIQGSDEPKLGLVYTWAKAVGVNGLSSYESKAIERGDVRRALLTTNFIMSASVLVRKEAMLRSGLFDDSMPSCQDWDMWVRLAMAGYNFDVVDEILTIYHRHGGESIGLGGRARLGYYVFLRKHATSIFKHTSLLNILRKLYLYLQVRSAAKL